MAAGFVGILSFELHLPDGGSLKAKRKHLLHTKAQLERKFGASVAEVDFHDRWQRSRLTMAIVRREHNAVQQALVDAERYLSMQEYELLRLDPHGALRRERPARGRAALMPGDRMRRVNEVLREVLAEGVEGLGDPGLGFVTVTVGAGGPRRVEGERLRQRPGLGAAPRAVAAGARACPRGAAVADRARAPPQAHSAAFLPL